jgi:hypothetical protein
MRTHQLLGVLITIMAFPLLPLTLVSQVVLGILFTLTFGLLLLPISLVWIIFLWGPLLGLSWLWLRLPLLRIPIAVVRIPLALLAEAYASLVPSMGERESRITKMLLASTWPYSWLYLRWDSRKLSLDDPAAKELVVALQREASGNAVHSAYIQYKVNS